MPGRHGEVADRSGASRAADQVSRPVPSVRSGKGKSAMSMIYCATTIGELSAYTDGELTADEESLLRRHLEECPACQQMTGILATLKEAVTSSVEMYPLPRALRVALQPRPRPQRWSLFS